MFDCGTTASNFTLITCRSPIYATAFLLGIEIADLPLVISYPIRDRSAIYR